MMISADALLGVLYSWYVSMRLKGLNEDQSIQSMVEAWDLSSKASKKNRGHVKRRSKEIISLMNNAMNVSETRSTDNEINELSDFGEIINDDDIGWGDADKYE